MEVRKLVPDVYYKESRDFSYIGRLFEVLFNYIKTGADLVKEGIIDGDRNSPSIILELLATTLGFETKHEYVVEDLVAICNCFTSILRKKGSLDAIYETFAILLRSQKIDAEITINRDPMDFNHLEIEIPPELTDRILVEDIFEYILPAGTVFTFVDVKSLGNNYQQEIKNENDVEINEMTDSQLSQVSNFNNLDPNGFTNRSATSTGKVFSVEIE